MKKVDYKKHVSRYYYNKGGIGLNKALSVRLVRCIQRSVHGKSKKITSKKVLERWYTEIYKEKA